MKFIYLTFILSCLYAFFSECNAKESVVYEYDAAGNRTARYIVTEDSDEQPGALRGAFAESDDITKSESVVTLGDLSVEVYPNPTNGPVVIDIKGDTDQPMNVEVFSNVGASLMSKAVALGKNMIDLSSYSDGQYIVVVTLGADKSTSFKVIKGNF
ncbi:MAG: T9SS type A sorting domain-containing protein [Paludibacteraceae bacterium]|nr:T9SS type A sorting domain-containing protein [Paludibacteraceae bacterium]